MNLVFFNAINTNGKETFLKVEDICSIEYDNTQDCIQVGMRNGERYGFHGYRIRTIHNKMSTDKTISSEVKTTAEMFYDILASTL